ncbi:MAG: hypothetical protein IKV03_02360 [Alphaproteobacteria bacterium]|nr:hypothetical protein [Alphaproteobacteria bacterium]
MFNVLVNQDKHSYKDIVGHKEEGVVFNMLKPSDKVIGENIDVSQKDVPLERKEVEEYLPCGIKIVNRDEAKTFTEYFFSKPVTFAHKCEELMINCSAAAMLSGVLAAIAVASPSYIPANEKVALGCLGVMGLCMLGVMISGVTGGVKECFDERKKRMLQERMEHTRD